MHKVSKVVVNSLVLSRIHYAIIRGFISTSIEIWTKNFSQVTLNNTLKYFPIVRFFQPRSNFLYLYICEKKFNPRDEPQTIISRTRMIITEVINRSLSGISFGWWNERKSRFWCLRAITFSPLLLPMEQKLPRGCYIINRCKIDRRCLSLMIMSTWSQLFVFTSDIDTFLLLHEHL